MGIFCQLFLMKKNIDSISISEPNNLRRNIAKDLGADHIINPQIPSHIKEKLLKISIDVHKGTGCNCISRLDFRYEEHEDEVYLLEVNTQPGLTQNSLLPEMARNNGINFNELCKILIENSICENL